MWWTANPDANIGIATGKISNLVVVDVDGEEGKKSLAELKAKNITVDAMGTGAACRTYNVLLSEERRVAAALVAI